MTSTPTISAMYRAMSEAYKQKADEAEVFVVSSSRYGDYTQATAGEIADWMIGENMPPMQPFGKWWLALSIQLRLPSTAVYKVDWDQINGWMQLPMPLRGYPSAPQTSFIKYAP